VGWQETSTDPDGVYDACWSGRYHGSKDLNHSWEIPWTGPFAIRFAVTICNCRRASFVPFLGPCDMGTIPRPCVRSAALHSHSAKFDNTRAIREAMDTIRIIRWHSVNRKD
jgi:hypothetical protein